MDSVPCYAKATYLTVCETDSEELPEELLFTTHIDEFGDFKPPLVDDVGTIFIDEMYQYGMTQPNLM